MGIQSFPALVWLLWRYVFGFFQTDKRPEPAWHTPEATALPVSYGLPGLKTCRMPFPVQLNIG